MIATTVEQSRHLLELGLDTATSDMCLCKTAQCTWSLCAYTPGEYDAHTIPAWSLSALLEVMPSNLYYQHVVVHIEKGHYSCIRNIHDPECEDGPYGVHATFGNTAIESAYEMVCWLLRNNFIKKNYEH